MYENVEEYCGCILRFLILKRVGKLKILKIVVLEMLVKSVGNGEDGDLVFFC